MPAKKKKAARKPARKSAPKPARKTARKPAARQVGPGVTTSPTQPFTGTAHHAQLAKMAGAWRGVTSTWFDPTKQPEESTTEVRVDVLLGGRFARLTYASNVMGGPHAGEMTIGHEDDRFTIAWIDSFHTGRALTPLVGERGASGISCLGSYAAGVERWGWRIAVALTSGGELVIEEWNISPAGEADRSIKMHLSRARSRVG